MKEFEVECVEKLSGYVDGFLTIHFVALIRSGHTARSYLGYGSTKEEAEKSAWEKVNDLYF